MTFYYIGYIYTYMTKRELKELIKECIIEHKQLTNEVQLDEGYKDILTAMAIAGAIS